MDQAVMAFGGLPSVEPIQGRGARSGASMTLTLSVTDPEVLAELRRQGDTDRQRYALAALRVGILALRAASGQIDSASIREAGSVLVGEVRQLLTERATETTERIAASLTQYLDPQSGVLPQRLQALVREDGELERVLRAHLDGEDSVLARTLASSLGEGSAIFKLLSPSESGGLRAQLAATLEQALTEQRRHILREFSLDQKDSALSRLFAQFSFDEDGSALSRLSKMLAATSEQIGKNLTLDDDESALARMKRELLSTIDRLAHDNVEFQCQVREALARLDARRRADAQTPRHGVTFEERLGALLGEEAARLGDVHEATGDSTGVIRQCKKGDHVIELGADSAAAHARIVWEAKERQGFSLRSALEEIDEARRNRRAQVGVFVFSRTTAPEGLEALQRHGSDIVVVWDADDPASDLVVRAAHSLARALVVRERRSDREALAAIAEIERATRAIERQIGHLAEVRKWAETVKGHGEKIADRSSKMVDELGAEVERLDQQVAGMRKAGQPAEG